VIGLDVDVYKPGGGADAIDRLEAFLGCPLPETTVSTSREDGSGIRLYRVTPPPATSGRNPWKKGPVKAVEVIQRGHRYCVAWPSIHPGDATTPPGNLYRWLDQRTGDALEGPPDFDDLPLLPDVAVERLRERRMPETERDPVDVELTDGDPSPAVARRLAEAIADLDGHNGARHDQTCKHTAALVRLAERKHPDVAPAIKQLRGEFVAAIADRAAAPEAEREYDAMVAEAQVKVASTEGTVPPYNTQARSLVVADGDGGDPRAPDRVSEIDVGMPLAKQADAGIAAIVRKNNPSPTAFVQDRHLAVAVVEHDGAAVIYRLDHDGIRAELGRAASWIRTNKNGTVEATPTLALAHWVAAEVARNRWPLPRLDRVVTVPVFGVDGTLRTEPGYDPATKTYYAPPPGFEVSIPAAPTTAEVAAAVEFITHNVLSGFPFVGGDEATAWAFLILAFVRAMIPGPTPLHVFDAPTARTGKSLLAEVLTRIFAGHWAPEAEPPDEAEWGKRLLAKLRQGASHVVFDNLAATLDSGSFASVLTGFPYWESRVLGQSTIARVSTSCVWAATGNNVIMSEELAGRVVRCRLDARMADPSIRSDFVHRDLRGWFMQNRSALVRAVLVIVQSWIAAGRPTTTVPAFGGFESWASTVGSILAHAGIHGFLVNRTADGGDVTDEGTNWEAAVAAWAARLEHPAPAREILGLLIAAEVDLHVPGWDDAARAKTFGQMLARHRDRVYDGWQIKRAKDDRLKRALWHLEPVRDGA